MHSFVRKRIPARPTVGNPACTDALVSLLRDVALAMFRRFTSLDYIAAAFHGSGVEEITADILVHACLGDGFPVADLAEWVFWDPYAEPDPHQMGYTRTLMALHTMAAEGIVEIDTHYKVPPCLHKAIAFELVEGAGEKVDYEDPEDANPSYAGAAT